MTGRAPGKTWTRAALAAAMAYVLVVQALLLAAGGALHAAAAAQPQGIICLQDGSSAPDHAPAKAHDTLCCTVSCHGSAAAGPAPSVAMPARWAPEALAGNRPAPSPRLTLTSTVLPLGSRAPPRLG